MSSNGAKPTAAAAELFRVVAEFPTYRIGPDGSVWHVGTYINEPDKWQLKRVQTSGGRAPFVALWRGNHEYRRSVAKLVRIAFAPKLPAGRPGDDEKARGSAHGRAKLTEQAVIEARRLRSEGASYEDLQVRFGVGRNTLFHCLTGRTWRHVPMP